MSPFRRVDYESHILFESAFGHVVFGFRHLTQSDLPAKFPDVDFCSVKQIHSNLVVPSRTNILVEADGHWTVQKKQAPLIQTADCLPIMLVSPRAVLALHAGWRGLETNISAAGLKHLATASFSPQEFYAFIGPHISARHFEVGLDVAERLATSYRQTGKAMGSLLLAHPDSEKKFVDLHLLARAQLLQAGVPDHQILHVDLDTYSDQRFESYRKTRSGGRQWSFCYLK